MLWAGVQRRCAHSKRLWNIVYNGCWICQFGGMAECLQVEQTWLIDRTIFYYSCWHLEGCMCMPTYFTQWRMINNSLALLIIFSLVVGAQSSVQDNLDCSNTCSPKGTGRTEKWKDWIITLQVTGQHGRLDPDAVRRLAYPIGPTNYSWWLIANRGFNDACKFNG